MKPIENIPITELIEEASRQVIAEKKKGATNLIMESLRRIEQVSRDITVCERELEKKRKELDGLNGKMEKLKGGDWSVLVEPKQPGVKASSSATCSADSLANNIATAIMITGDGRLCHRVQLKIGSYPNHEKSGGGYCHSALVNLIAAELKGQSLKAASRIADAISDSAELEGATIDQASLVRCINESYWLPPNAGADLQPHRKE